MGVQLPKVEESQPPIRYSFKIDQPCVEWSYTWNLGIQLLIQCSRIPPPSDAIPVIPVSMPVPEPPHSLPALVKQKLKAPPSSFSPMRTRSASKAASKPTNSVPNSETSSMTNKDVPPVRYPQGVTRINIVTIAHVDFAVLAVRCDS